jgi:hypothetical protein
MPIDLQFVLPLLSRICGFVQGVGGFPVRVPVRLSCMRACLA